MTMHRDLLSPLGTIRLSGNEQALHSVRFVEPSGLSVAAASCALLECAAQQLSEYFDGRRRHFDLPLAPVGTAFQQRVWAALRRIGFGSTCSYAQLAREIGADGAARAVGAANRSNPIAIIVPCHRVIGSNGRLTGYAGGLDRKQSLLAIEGIASRA